MPIPSHVIWAGPPKMIEGRKSVSMTWGNYDAPITMGGPASKKVGPWDHVHLVQLFNWRVRPEYMTSITRKLWCPY